MKGLTKLIFGVMIGGVYGMLFAQKPGKKLRSELATSENPLKTLFSEGLKVDKEARSAAVEWAKNSEELQKVMTSGKDQFNAVVAAGKEMTDDARNEAQKKLEEVAANATKAAHELRDSASQKLNRSSKKATKSIAKAKKTASKKIDKTAKTVNKKATAAKKTVNKKVEKVTKK
jgi:gas vesicle protein